MKCFYIPIVFLFSTTNLIAQGFVQSSTNETISNAGLSLTTFDNYYSNPSALADLKSFNFQITLKNFYELESLFSKSVAIGMPLKDRNTYATMYYNRSGTTFFKTQNLALGIGKRISKQIAIGANFQIGNQVIEGWSSPIDFGIAFGFLYHANNKMKYSSVYRFSKDYSILSFGLEYELLKELNLYLQIDKELKRNVEFRYGLIYSINKKMNMGIGMIPLQSIITIGTTFLFKDNIDIGVSFKKDLYLGYSPTATVKISW